MPATQFDGANDVITCSPGACSGADAHTWVSVFRRNTTGVWQALADLEDAGATTVISALEINPSNNLNFDNGSVSSTGPSLGTNVTDWFMAVLVAPAGAATPTFYLANLTTGGAGGSFSSTLGSASVAKNAATPGRINFGEYQGVDDFNGWMIVKAFFNVALTAGQVAELNQHLRTSDIWDCSAGRPAGLWQLNGSSVVDLTGGGANESSRNGTSIDAAAGEPWLFDDVGTKPILLGTSAVTTPGASSTVTTTVAVSAATRLFLRYDYITSGAALTVNTITGGSGITWTRVGGINGLEASGARMHIELYTALVPSLSSGTTFTATLSGVPFGTLLSVWRQPNSDTVTLVDGTPAGTLRATPGSTTVTSPSVTVSVSDANLYFMTLADGPASSGGVSYSVSAPWAEPWAEIKEPSDDFSSGMAYQRVTTAGSYSGSGTWSTTPTFGDISLLVAARNASAGPPPPILIPGYSPRRMPLGA